MQSVHAWHSMALWLMMAHLWLRQQRTATSFRPKLQIPSCASVTPNSILAVSQSFRDPRGGQSVERIGKLDDLDDQNPQAKWFKLSRRISNLLNQTSERLLALSISKGKEHRRLQKRLTHQDMRTSSECCNASCVLLD